MGFEVKSSTIVCPRCGQGYSKRQSYFYTSKASMHKGISYIPICKVCVDQLYEGYLAASDDPKLAVRQMCRKLDLYWDEKTYTSCINASARKNVMVTYLTRLNNMAYAGKCYDDTLKEEDMLWSFRRHDAEEKDPEEVEPIDVHEGDGLDGIPEEVIRFWGPGYNVSMYTELQQRYEYWLSRFPDNSTLDVGGEILLKQICSLEIDINRDRAAGRPTDKSLNALNTLLGSAMLKPAQKKTDDGNSSINNTPYGLLIKKFEDERPIPEVDPELKDVDKVIWYITVWFFGHLCKMLNIKNSYCKLYEEAIEARRIDNPDLEYEDEDELIADIFAEKDNYEDSDDESGDDEDDDG